MKLQDVTGGAAITEFGVISTNYQLTVVEGNHADALELISLSTGKAIELLTPVHVPANACRPRSGFFVRIDEKVYHIVGSSLPSDKSTEWMNEVLAHMAY